jgi:uncharacterized membrane protein YgcG
MGNLTQTAVMPQSDVAMVSYSFDPDTGTLSRSMSAVPNPDALPQPDAPSAMMSHRVRSITFQFLDPNSGARLDWAFTNDQATGGTSSADMTSGNMMGGDTYLPQSVQITIEFMSDGGPSNTYTTTVTLANPTVQPAGQTPASTATTGGTGGAGGSGGGGGTGGGGSGGGGSGGGLPELPGAGGPRP